MKTLKRITMLMTVVFFIVFLSGFKVAVGQTVSVTTPNGGETWTAGTTNAITWTSDVIGNVRIALLKNGIQYSLIASALPNNGSFNWLIPAAIMSGTNYTVKISSCTNPLISDVSDSNFTIAGGSGSTISLTSPNGGESWTAGTMKTVTWTSDIIGNVRIVLLKNGLQYSLIASFIPNTGSFNWLIPAGIPAGTTFTVKISSCTNPVISDVSDANFSIIAGGGTIVAITSPNGGEIWTAATPNTITWTSDITGNVRIVLLKGGIQSALIASALPNIGSFTWLVPPFLVTGTDYTVKISSCINPAVTDVSDSNFTINGDASTVTVISPNGGETWVAGTSNTITWDSDIIGNVRIVLLNAGIQRALIASAVPNSGSFNWLIPAGIGAGTDYTVKISSCSNYLISDVSDASFSINPGGGGIVTVTSPNGGEAWTSGTLNTITWTGDITGFLRIALLKNGIQHSLIASRIPNNGSYNWLIPAWIASGADYTVKISSCTNPLIFDVSDANFTINGGSGSTLIITSPNGGETWVAGTANTITWTSDIIGNVRIVLLKAGIQCSLIAAGTPNDGSHTWLIPAGIVPGTDYTVKISMCVNSFFSDVSDSNFEIAIADNSILKTGVPADDISAPVLNLYPNPASDKLSIDADRNMSRVWLLNSLGQTVLETVVNARQLQLNVGEFNTGVYFVRIETGETITTSKIIIK